MEFLLQCLDLCPDLLEALFRVADEIHLVDGKDEVADAHERADAGMAARLRQDALRRVDEDDGEVGERCAAGHVARVLLMARRIRADEAAVVRREVAVGDIDRDALLALREQSVQEQRVVDGTAAAADFRIEQQRFFLVGVDELGIVQEMADERGLAVVDAAAGDEFE